MRLQLRYSLRTFLVVIALVACWLGYQLRIISQRTAMLAQIKAQGGVCVTYAAAQPLYLHYLPELDVVINPPPELVRQLLEGPQKKAQISRLREWLGDPPIQTITLLRPEFELAQVTALFPEAIVMEAWVSKQAVLSPDEVQKLRAALKLHESDSTLP